PSPFAPWPRPGRNRGRGTWSSVSSFSGCKHRAGPVPRQVANRTFMRAERDKPSASEVPCLTQMFALRGLTILAIAPHIDDVELGAGGALHAWSADNTVYYVGLSIPPNTHEASFMEEFRVSLDALNISWDRAIRKAYNPRDLASDRVQILNDF